MPEAREVEERSAGGLARGPARIHGLPQVYEDMEAVPKERPMRNVCEHISHPSTPTNLREGPCTVAENPIALEKEVEGEKLYRMRQRGLEWPPDRPPFLVKRAARVACSNTSRTPSLVFAEHSRYLWAPIFLRTSSPYIIHVSMSVWDRAARIVFYVLPRH